MVVTQGDSIGEEDWVREGDVSNLGLEYWIGVAIRIEVASRLLEKWH